VRRAGLDAPDRRVTGGKPTTGRRSAILASGIAMITAGRIVFADWMDSVGMGPSQDVVGLVAPFSSMVGRYRLESRHRPAPSLRRSVDSSRLASELRSPASSLALDPETRPLLLQDRKPPKRIGIHHSSEQRVALRLGSERTAYLPSCGPLSSRSGAPAGSLLLHQACRIAGPFPPLSAVTIRAPCLGASRPKGCFWQKRADSGQPPPRSNPRSAPMA